ncbi:MAG TPA: copper homeostasis protein CutC [Chloroflexota bacterium]|nr:copper homeostasis protein CutC [Chloroflexota bacterium]
MKFEICVDSCEGVRAARDAGADRVELCANLLEGGTTPSLGAIRRARTVTGIGLHVIIRPRGGDFLYSDDEFEEMKIDILAAREEGANGVVFGLLQSDGRVDAERSRLLIEAARPMAVTFHRAFDMAADPFEALDTLIDLGVERVLTSGQEESVLEGLPLITSLNQRAGARIIVMPGGGITSRNVERIVRESGVREIHFAALEVREGGMRFRRDGVFMGGALRAPEYARSATSSNLIRDIMTATRPG